MGIVEIRNMKELEPYSNTDFNNTIRDKERIVSKINFVNYNLFNLLVQGVIFSDCEFEYCLFDNVIFEGCTFCRCSFNNCTFKEGSSIHSRFYICKFKICTLDRVRIKHTSIDDCSAFIESEDLTIDTTTIDDLRIRTSIITNSFITSSTLTSVSAVSVGFSGASFHKTGIYYSDFHDSTFEMIRNGRGDVVINSTEFYDCTGVDDFVPYVCPRIGTFIGYKVCSDAIAVLRIPKDAKRSSGYGNKCRCDKAEVIEFYTLEGNPSLKQTAESVYDPNFIYTVGKTVTSDFDDNRWAECSKGIHFFMSLEEAYAFGMERHLMAYSKIPPVLNLRN